MNRLRSRPLLLTSLAATALAVAALWWAWPALRARNGTNLHTVVPGAVLRSGQLSATELEAVVRRHSVRTVVNLRGSQPGTDWYEEEIEVTERLGVGHVDVQLFSDRQPPRPTVVELIDVLETAPRPILVHCDVGADRAGFASVVALLLEGDDIDAARRQLARGFGHLPFGPAAELDRFFDAYEHHLVESGTASDGAAFKRWVRDAYVPYGYGAALEIVHFPPRATAGVPFEVRVRATNLGSAPWPPGSQELGQGVRLGFRVRRQLDGELVHYPHRIDVEESVQPGESAEFRGLFFTPTTAGRYTLTADLVDETVTWFEDQGSETVSLELVVEPRR